MIKIPKELDFQDNKTNNQDMLKRFILKLIGMFILTGIWIHLQYNPWAISDLFAQGHFEKTGSANYVHADGETATLLKDGRVLVVGGFNGKSVTGTDYVAGTEIYNPKTGVFHDLGKTIYPRDFHTATLLNDGRVLIAGGLEIDGCTTAEVFDPKVNRFYSLGNMRDGICYDTAIMLNNGRVLLNNQIFDPETNKFFLTGKMNYYRDDYTATLLKDGRVLITGGETRNYDNKPNMAFAGVTSTAEIYDPSTGRYTLTGSMNYPRREHTATLLPDGKVLIAGGYSKLFKTDPSEPSNFVFQPELYDPVTGTFTKIDKIPHLDADIATSLKDGRVLLSMYDEQVDSMRAVIYDPATGKLRLSGHRPPDSGGTATLLQNGNVLFIGGPVNTLYIP